MFLVSSRAMGVSIFNDEGRFTTSRRPQSYTRAKFCYDEVEVFGIPKRILNTFHKLVVPTAKDWMTPLP